MPKTDDIWVAERVPSQKVAHALISLLHTRRHAASLRADLLWLAEEPLRRGLRRLILNGRRVRLNDVSSTAITAGLRGYAPSKELGLFLTTNRGIELYIMPRADSPGRSVQYNIGVVAPLDTGVRTQRYLTILRRAGVEIEERTKATVWLEEAQKIVAYGLQD